MRCGQGEERGLIDTVAIFVIEPAFLLSCRTQDQRGSDAWFLRDVGKTTSLQAVRCRRSQPRPPVGPRSLTVGQTVVRASPPRLGGGQEAHTNRHTGAAVRRDRAHPGIMKEKTPDGSPWS